MKSVPASLGHFIVESNRVFIHGHLYCVVKTMSSSDDLSSLPTPPDTTKFNLSRNDVGDFVDMIVRDGRASVVFNTVPPTDQYHRETFLRVLQELGARLTANCVPVFYKFVGTVRTTKIYAPSPHGKVMDGRCVKEMRIVPSSPVLQRRK